MLETVIKTIAIHSHFETFSLNRNNAIKVVAMISKLPSREAFADVLLLPAKVGIMVMAYQAELHCAIQVFLYSDQITRFPIIYDGSNTYADTDYQQDGGNNIQHNHSYGIPIYVKLGIMSSELFEIADREKPRRSR